MGSYLDFMKELAIPQKERRLVMAENAIELYGLDPQNSLLKMGGRR
jgi:predicted TIM-barrel fold metal-dependent hydrolase